MGNIYILFVFLTMFWVTPSVSAQTNYEKGLISAAKSYGLDELVKEAKRSDPNSNLPSIIEHLLAGLSLSTDPTTIMRDTYPGYLAANAIGQLIGMHGKDIANMTYRERKVFIGDEYGDPSLIPNSTYSKETDTTDSLCRKMFKVEQGGVSECKNYVVKIQSCGANNRPSKLEIKHCYEYLTEFYEHMEYEGKTSLVRHAGEVAIAEFNKVKSRRIISELSDFVGKHKLAFTCTSGCTGVWRHTMSVTSMDQEGNFSGTGYYDGDHGYTWNVKGQLSGDTVNFKMVYTGKNRGYTSTNSGKISSNGTMAGTGFSSTGQKHSWSN